MGLRQVLMCTALAAVSTAMFSCSPDDEMCERVEGIYQPLYVARSGNCGPITGMSVPLDGGSGGVKTHMEMQFGRDVFTMVVHKGCSLRVSQQIYMQGVLQSEMYGDEIAVHSAKELVGQVEYKRFEGTPQPTCIGMYDVTFKRPDTVLNPISPVAQ